MTFAAGATTYVVGVLSALLVSRCQRGESVGFAFVRVFAFVSLELHLCCFGLDCACETCYSIIWCKTYALKLNLLSIMLSVIYFVARNASSKKYRGSVDPSMCVVQSKAFI